MIKKIKWVNVIKLLIFLFCIGVIAKDFYMLTIYSWITGKYCGYTWFGFLTAIYLLLLASAIYDDFEEQIKKMSTTRNSQHLR